MRALATLSLIALIPACNFGAVFFPACGNGILDLDQGEQCDDGNTTAGDGCDPNCQNEIVIPPACGDGVVNPGEECDDGNNVSGDDCLADCRVPVDLVSIFEFDRKIAVFP